MIDVIFAVLFSQEKVEKVVLENYNEPYWPFREGDILGFLNDHTPKEETLEEWFERQ